MMIGILKVRLFTKTGSSSFVTNIWVDFFSDFFIPPTYFLLILRRQNMSEIDEKCEIN